MFHMVLLQQKQNKKLQAEAIKSNKIRKHTKVQIKLTQGTILFLLLKLESLKLLPLFYTITVYLLSSLKFEIIFFKKLPKYSIFQ